MRLRSIVIAATAATALVVPSGTASASTAQCSIVVPSKIVMQHHYQAVPLRLSSNCAANGAVYASWDFVHSTQGWDDGASFDLTTTQTTSSWDVYDSWEPLGRYAVRPSTSYRADYSDLTQNTATTTIKLGTRLTTTTARSSTRLTFYATASIYSRSRSAMAPRAGATVSLLYLAPGSSSWTWVKKGTANSSGKVTLSVTPKRGQYRLVVSETTTAWASYSSIVTGA